VVSLGLSFISGCFISAELIDEKILNFSKIFPSYWFIQGNHDIARMSEFGISNMYGVFVKYGIILGFGLLYFIIAQFGSKR
jgi:ABC-2 type transport system permease protein